MTARNSKSNLASGDDSADAVSESQIEAELLRLQARVQALESQVAREKVAEPTAETEGDGNEVVPTPSPAKAKRSQDPGTKPSRPVSDQDATAKPPLPTIFAGDSEAKEAPNPVQTSRVKPGRPISKRAVAAELQLNESAAGDDVEPSVPKQAAVAVVVPTAGAEPESAFDNAKSIDQMSVDDSADTDSEPSLNAPHQSLLAYLFREGVPSWSVSTVLHAVILLILALYALPRREEQKEAPITVVVAEVVQDVEEMDEDVQLEIETPESEQSQPDLSHTIEDAGAADLLGEMTQSDTEVLADFGEVGTFDDLADVGFDLTELGEGKGLTGDGEGLASFFGVKTKGRRFMFVVDNSNSMNNGKFETAVMELQKSISKLNYNHEFFIVFYSDTAYPLFYPRSAKTWVKATPENREKLRYWLQDVQRCLQTRGIKALTTAFGMKPDVIYLLGDGSFTDKAVPATLGFEDTRVVVHTMGFGMKDAARSGFEKIATKFRGNFHEVAVTPKMREYSKQVNRPKNNQKNGVWGIKLGEGKKKKKK
jgi:hypothetical protein